MKKIISTILILTMLFSTAVMLTAFPASAADEVEKPNYDETWTPISSAAELKEKVKANGKYYLTQDIIIDSNWDSIGYNEKAGKPACNGFILDGRDQDGVIHSVIFGSRDGSATTDKSLFGAVGVHTIQNLKLEGYMEYSTVWRASPLSDNYFRDPKLINISSSVNITYTGGNVDAEPLAGLLCWLVDEGSSLIENCEYTGTIRFANGYVKGVGGIVGIVRPQDLKSGTTGGVIRNCTNKGTFSFSSTYLANTGGRSVGGIVANIWNEEGQTNANFTVEGCVNAAEAKYVFDNVTTYTEDQYHGGIVGRINSRCSTTIKDCINYANLNQGYSFSHGGIVGKYEFMEGAQHVIDGCKNYGAFTFTENVRFVGGIVACAGNSLGKLTIKNCENNGDIFVANTATIQNHECLGGILARIFTPDSSYKATPGVDPKVEIIITNSVNNGDLTVEDEITGTASDQYSYHVGGIVGRAYSAQCLRINRCANNGDITMLRVNHKGGWRAAGGIVASFMTARSAMYLQILNSTNKGNMTCVYAGGILGATFQLYYNETETSNSAIDIKNCSNSGTITATYNQTWDTGNNWGDSKVGDAGGIIGTMDQGGRDYLTTSVNISYCLNEGNIRASRFAGGIFGVRDLLSSQKNSKVYIDHCANTGKIETKSGDHYFAASGIFGSAKAYIKMTNCVNTGELGASKSGTGYSGYTTVPLVNLHEDAWGAEFGTEAEGNANYFSADGESTSASYINYSQGKKLDGTSIIGIKNETKAKELVTKITQACFKGEQVSYEDSLSGQTILLTDLRSLALYERGVRSFIVASDISYSGSGAVLSTFEGATLEGQDYTITLGGSASIFGAVKDSTISNVNLKGDVSYNDTMGPLAKEVGKTSVIDNVNSSVNITDTTSSIKHIAIGGVVGAVGINGEVNNVTVRNCSSSGTITGTRGNTYREICIGGIAGHFMVGSKDDNLTIQDCTNSGSITGTRVAGIVGGVCTDNRQSGTGNDKLFQDAQVKIIGCTNEGSIDGFALAAGILADATDRAYLAGENPTDGSRNALKIPYAEMTVDGCLNKGSIRVSTTPGSLTGVSNAWNGHIIATSGIVGVANGHITIKGSINQGRIDSTTSNKKGAARPVAGILAMKLQASYEDTDKKTGVLIENCKNAGTVEGDAYNIGGVVGYVWRGNLTVKSCVNTGHVITSGSGENTLYAAAGILGHVRTNGDSGDTYSANGTYYEGKIKFEYYNKSEYKVNIENCINAGKIEIKNYPQRDADVWKMVAGIVGPCETGVKITGCLHTGWLEDNAPWFNSTFPITNSLEMKWAFPDYRLGPVATAKAEKKTVFENVATDSGWSGDVPSNFVKAVPPTELHVYSDNYYTAGSLDEVLVTSSVTSLATNPDYHVTNHYGKELYQMSSLATDEQVKFTIQRANVYSIDSEWYDSKTYLEEQIEFGKYVYDDADHRGLEYTDEQLTTLGNEIAKGEALMTKTDAQDPWRRQNEVYVQEQAIRDAVMAYSTDSWYEVIIPERLPTNSEIEVEVKVENFSYYDGVKISLLSSSGNKLTLAALDQNEKRQPNEYETFIPYSMWYEGDMNYLMFAQPAMSMEELKANNLPLVYTTKDKETGEHVPMVQSMIARVIMTDEESAKKALGIYTDSVTFKIEKINVDSQ